MKTTKEKIAVMQAYVEGRQLQIETGNSGDRAWVDFTYTEEPEWNWMSRDYRIKPLEFPPLPEGLEWHVAEEDSYRITPELVGPNHRLCVVGEMIPNQAECFYRDPPLWRASTRIGFGLINADTIRVPICTPFPEPPKKKVMMPLGPEDAPPGSVFTIKGRPEHDWTMPESVSTKGITFTLGEVDGMSYSSVKTWEQAQQHYLIKRPGQDWQPCEKEAP